jgi:hypothetical protein
MNKVVFFLQDELFFYACVSIRKMYVVHTIADPMMIKNIFFEKYD